MDKIGIRDTTAYRIIRQIIDHTWGSDIELEDPEIINICQSFHRLGGSWEQLMNGDISNFTYLEQSIDTLIAPKKLELMSWSI
jgi:hypothetical protein